MSTHLGFQTFSKQMSFQTLPNLIGLIWIFLRFQKQSFQIVSTLISPIRIVYTSNKKGFRDLPNLVSPMWILLDVKKNIFLVPSKPHELDVDFVTFWQHGFSKVPKKSQPE